MWQKNYAGAFGHWALTGHRMFGGGCLAAAAAAAIALPCPNGSPLPGAGFALQVDRWHYEIPGYVWDTSKLADPKYPTGPEVPGGGMLLGRSKAGTWLHGGGRIVLGR